jgi:tetratricopeptide (TPR) repeat protein
MAQKNYDAALADYDLALTKDPKLVLAIINIGLIKYEQGKLDDAIAQWNKAIAIDSNLAEPQFAMAIALFTKGDQEKGLSIAEAALKIDKQFGDTAYLKKNAWGDRLVADAQKLLASPRMQAILPK